MRLLADIIEGPFAPSWFLRLVQSRLIRLEQGADGLSERSVVAGRGQIQGLLEMLNGFIQLPLRGQRAA
jgi:hypothetical protein